MIPNVQIKMAVSLDLGRGNFPNSIEPRPGWILPPQILDIETIDPCILEIVCDCGRFGVESRLVVIVLVQGICKVQAGRMLLFLLPCYVGSSSFFHHGE